MKVLEIDETDSTNEYCKRLGFGKDVAVCAKRQAAGKGTKGRSFCSDEGGVYISVMKNYQNFSAENAFKIMVNACVAVCKTLEDVGVRPVIRWANDVLVNGKKICGTLIENTFCGDKITRSIVGIGINVCNKLPKDLRGIATTVCNETDKKISVEEVRRGLLKNLEREFDIADYKKYINWFNTSVTIKTACGEYAATALDVSNDGRLVVETDGKIEKISAAEVGLRLNG